MMYHINRHSVLGQLMHKLSVLVHAGGGHVEHIQQEHVQQDDL